MTIISDVTHTGESDTTTVRDIPTLPEHPTWCDGNDEWMPANVPGDTDDRHHHHRTEWFQIVQVDFRDTTTGAVSSAIEVESTVGGLFVEDLDGAIAQLVAIKDLLERDQT